MARKTQNIDIPLKYEKVISKGRMLANMLLRRAGVEGSKAKARHQNMIGAFAERLKPMMRNCGATCSLPQSPYHCTLLPYSVHEKTGMASIPINLKSIRNFSHQRAWLGSK